MVGDGAFASLKVFQMLRDDAVCIARCRMDARFFNPPPLRKTGQKGRPRIVGTRQLTPKTRAVRKATQWVRMTIPGWRPEDGTMDREIDVATGTALWNVPGITLPMRWVLTRNSVARGETRVVVCSDTQRSAAQILTWYAMRWSLEVTFAESRRHLGVETQRQWSDLAIQRTTPLLFGLFSLVSLWAAELAAKTATLPVSARLGTTSWTRRSRTPSPSSGGSSGPRRPCARSCGGTIFRLGGRAHEPPKNPGPFSSVWPISCPTPPNALRNRQSPA
jgi:hypothetical protein